MHPYDLPILLDQEKQSENWLHRRQAIMKKRTHVDKLAEQRAAEFKREREEAEQHRLWLEEQERLEQERLERVRWVADEAIGAYEAAYEAVMRNAGLRKK